MRSHLARWVAVALAVVAVGFVAVLATRDPAAARLADSPLLGRLSPEVRGTDLDGDVVRLSQYRGRYVVLNFFAAWCQPCRAEHDDLLRFAARHAVTGDAEVLAVLFDDTPDAARRFFADNGGDWPVLVDAAGKVALEFGVRGPPESFLISPDGIVLSHIVGEVDVERLDALVDQAERGR